MDRSDVFISYRRTNVEFVKKIVDTLQKSGREVWIDWEDIPPGSVGFSEDIRRGIEGADTFLAVLSPDYLTSTYCVDLELGYAVELNKRIIPIVYEKFDQPGSQIMVPASIGHINWVYFVPHAGQQNTFEQSFPRIIDAMDADYDYVKMHTNLITRAREWESKGHNPSFLLTGDAISAAEAWMARGVNLKPAPSELQSNYIMESRKAATRRQRRLIGVAAVVMVILAVLAVAAVLAAVEANRQSQIAALNEQEANRQRDIARDQERQARSLSIAARAELELNGNNPERSVLFGMEAVNLTYSVAAERALHRGVTENRLLHTYADAGSVINVIWSPDEEYIVTNLYDSANNQINVNLREVETGELLIEQWNSLAAAVGGSRFAIAGNGLLEIHDFEEARVTATTQITNEEILNLLSSPDGQFVALQLASGVTVYRVDNLGIEATFADAVQFQWFESVDENGSPGMVVQRPREGSDMINEILVYRLGEFAPQRTHFGTGADASPDGRYLLVTNADTESIEVWALTTSATQPITTLSGINAFWSPQGRHFLVAQDSWSQQLLWDVETLDSADSAAAQPVLQVEGIGAYFSGGGEYVLFEKTRPSATQPALVHVHDIDTLERVYEFTGSLIYSPDETLFAESGVNDDRIRIRDAASGRLLFFVVGFRAFPYWSPSGQLMALNDDQSLSIWDATLSPSEFVFEGGIHTWSPDNTRLLVSRDPLLDIDAGFITDEWEINSGQLLASVEGIHPVWSPDNVHYTTLIPTGDTQAAPDVINAPADTILHTSEAEQAPRRFEGKQPAFSFDGAYLSVTLVDDTPGSPISTTVYSVETGDALVTMRGGWAQWSPSAAHLITSESSQTYVTGSERKSWLWDASQPTILVEIEGSAATWSPDGRFFTTENRGEADESGRVPIETLIWQQWDLTLNGRTWGTLKAWSPDSSSAAILNHDDLTLWSVNTGGIADQVALNVFDIDSGLFAFSPDGTKLALSELLDEETFSRYAITIRDTAAGSTVSQFEIDVDGAVAPALSSLEWAPDSQRLAAIVSDPEVYAEHLLIIDVASGEALVDEQAYSVSWSPNGERAVSASRRGVATVWHVPLREALINIPLKSGGLYAVEWSPDGRFVVVTNEREVVLWRFFQSTQDLLTEAQRCCVLRELSDDERQLISGGSGVNEEE